MKTSQRILAVVNDRALYKKVADLFDRSSFEVNRIPSGAGALILIGNLRYDLIVVEAPLSDLRLPDFITAVRTLDSPCSGSPVLVLAQGESARPAEALTQGEDVDVISAESDFQEIQAAVSQLLGVAVRSATRILVQLHARLGEGTFKRVGQSANVSETGMLVTGTPELPFVCEVELEFELPGDSRPLAAKAQVVRHASPEVENVSGIGVRFSEISAETAVRLREFLATKVAEAAQREAAGEPLELDETAPGTSG